MSDHSNRIAWGTGRVAFRANLPAIQEMLDAGWPMSIVYQRVKEALGGVSYRQFTNHVHKHFNMGWRQPTTRYETINKSADAATVLKAPILRESINDEKPKTSGKPAKFQPGPRVPDPRQIY